jgi:TolA-binding protein
MTKRGAILIAAAFCFATAISANEVPASVPPPLARGVELYGEGKWREAILELRRASATTATSAETAEALYWIALAEIGAGEYEAAARDLDALIAAEPTGKWANEASYQKGRALFHSGRYDDAIIALKTYSDLSADDQRKSAAAYWIGECLYALGRLDDSRAVFSLIVEKYPDSLKYEASTYRIALIDQKVIEMELLKLLKWSHEESLRTVEEYQRRERSYEQAIVAYQKRIAEMLKDGRLADLERENKELAESLAAARASALPEGDLPVAEVVPPTVEAPSVKTAPVKGDSEKVSRLLALKAKALELKNAVQEKLGAAEPEGTK